MRTLRPETLMIVSSIFSFDFSPLKVEIYRCEPLSFIVPTGNIELIFLNPKTTNDGCSP